MFVLYAVSDFYLCALAWPRMGVCVLHVGVLLILQFHVLCAEILAQTWNTFYLIIYVLLLEGEPRASCMLSMCFVHCYAPSSTTVVEPRMFFSV